MDSQDPPDPECPHSEEGRILAGHIGQNARHEQRRRRCEWRRETEINEISYGGNGQ